MAEVENTIKGNLNVKGTTFTKNLNVEGTTYAQDLNIEGKVKANGGLVADGIEMEHSTDVIQWPDSGNYQKPNVTYPYNQGGLKWVGQSDGVTIWARETESDNLDLCIKFTDDNSNGLVIYNKSNQEVARISATGRAEFKQVFLAGKEIMAGADIQALRNENESLQSRVDSLNTQVEELQTENAELKEKIKELGG